MFGELIAQPGDTYDDFALPFMEARGDEEPPEMISAEVSEDPNFGWCATMMTGDGEEIQAHDFPNKLSLVGWLKEVVRIPERDIRIDE